MEKSELTPLVLEALRKEPSSQYASISSIVEHLNKGYVPARDGRKLVEVIWDLLVQGILAPGMGSIHIQSSVFFHVTEYGRQCLEAGEVVPHDPDGYMKRLANRVGGQLDDIVALYVHESLLTFVARRYLASAVMLGVASERCVDMLCSQLVEHPASSDSGSKLEKDLERAGRSVKQRFDLVREKLLAEQLPPQLRDALEIQLGGIFTLIRYTRNEAGHPAGRDVDRGIANANLGLFPSYCERVYGLLRHFGMEPGGADAA